MSKFIFIKTIAVVFTLFLMIVGLHVGVSTSLVMAQTVDPNCPDYTQYPACTSLDTGAMGFKIPSLGDLLTFAIRVFFVIAGLAALFYMILGAFAWITSGGDKDSITAARDKIQAAVIGMILIVAVLAIIWTLEQVIFNRRICLGLSCPLTLPGLLKTETANMCCSCLTASGALCGGFASGTEFDSCKIGGAGNAIFTTNLFDSASTRCAR